jgi:hypothetical protein
MSWPLESAEVLSLRHPGLEHPNIDALALSKIGRVIASRAQAKARDCEGRIKRKPSFGRSPRLFDFAFRKRMLPTVARSHEVAGLTHASARSLLRRGRTLRTCS